MSKKRFSSFGCILYIVQKEPEKYTLLSEFVICGIYLEPCILSSDKTLRVVSIKSFGRKGLNQSRCGANEVVNQNNAEQYRTYFCFHCDLNESSMSLDV